MNGVTLAAVVSDLHPGLDEKLVDRATGASRDERNERLMWLYSMNEYIGTRGTETQIEKSMRRFAMAQWEGDPTKNDFRRMFHIAIAALRHDVETKLITPLEKTLDKEELDRLRLKREAASSKRKAARKSKENVSDNIL